MDKDCRAKSSDELRQELESQSSDADYKGALNHGEDSDPLFNLDDDEED
jgi:hypothetical protein